MDALKLAQNKRGAFQDQRVCLVRSGDDRLAKVWGEYGGFEQYCDSPVYLVIGRQTCNEKCASLAERFGLAAETLIAFRDAPNAPSGFLQ